MLWTATFNATFHTQETEFWSSDPIPSVLDRKVSLAVAADALVDDGPHLAGGYSLHEEVNAACVLSKAGREGTRTQNCIFSCFPSHHSKWHITFHTRAGKTSPCRHEQHVEGTLLEAAKQQCRDCSWGASVMVDFSSRRLASSLHRLHRAFSTRFGVHTSPGSLPHSSNRLGSYPVLKTCGTAIVLKIVFKNVPEERTWKVEKSPRMSGWDMFCSRSFSSFTCAS